MNEDNSGGGFYLLGFSKINVTSGIISNYIGDTNNEMNWNLSMPQWNKFSDVEFLISSVRSKKTNIVFLWERFEYFQRLNIDGDDGKLKDSYNECENYNDHKNHGCCDGEQARFAIESLVQLLVH
ncbi:unnamed protein product [Rhizophagus irregularis]|nr:unnamed protein product [Rhizophagus irregularis]CAB5372491.1 unnamed protein product [Rhizophagus irregularis]